MFQRIVQPAVPTKDYFWIKLSRNALPHVQMDITRILKFNSAFNVRLPVCIAHSLPQNVLTVRLGSFF